MSFIKKSLPTLLLLMSNTVWGQQLIKIMGRDQYKNTDNVCLWNATLYIDENNNVDGKAKWGIESVSAEMRGQYRSKMSAKATEFLSGTYNPDTRTIHMHGTSKEDPQDILTLADYKLSILENGTVRGNTKEHGSYNSFSDWTITGNYTLTDKSAEKEQLNGNRYYKLANNLYVELSGEYPNGYKPSWKYVGKHEEVTMTETDFTGLKDRYAGNKFETYMHLDNNNGKGALFFNPRCAWSCRCVTYLDIPMGTNAIISARPTTFNLSNLQEPATGDNCTRGNLYSGTITLKTIPPNDDLWMDLTVESFDFDRMAEGYKGKMQSRWTGSFTMPNVSSRTSAAKAVSSKGGQQKVNQELAEKQLLQKQIDQMVKKQSSDWWINRYISGSMRNITIISRSASGKPAKVRGDYSFYSVSDKSDGWVEVLYSEGTPYNMRYWDKSDGIVPPYDYSPAERAKVQALNSKIANDKATVKEQKTRANYAAIMKKMRSYPATDLKNLAEATIYDKQWTTTTERDFDDRTTNQGTIISVPTTKEVSYNATVKLEAWKNSSNRTIYIKGISTTWGKYDETVYEDITIAIPPGEKVRQVEVQEYYDNSQKNRQQYFLKVR